MQVPMEEILEILHSFPSEQRYCLAIMQDMQRKFNYIPREGMEELAAYLDCPLSSLYAMATFYKALSLKPKGKHIIKCCDGTACHIRGSKTIIDAVKRNLRIAPGEVTPDGLFSIEVVNCLGACAMAPVMLVDGVVFGKVTPERIPEILGGFREEAHGA